MGLEIHDAEGCAVESHTVVGLSVTTTATVKNLRTVTHTSSWEKEGISRARCLDRLYISPKLGSRSSIYQGQNGLLPLSPLDPSVSLSNLIPMIPHDEPPVSSGL